MPRDVVEMSGIPNSIFTAHPASETRMLCLGIHGIATLQAQLAHKVAQTGA